jgi:hypothetical protein
VLEQVARRGDVRGPVVDRPLDPARGPVDRAGDVGGRRQGRGDPRGVHPLDRERRDRVARPVPEVLADQQHAGAGGRRQPVRSVALGSDHELEPAVGIGGEVGERDLGEHPVLVEVHVALDQREQRLVDAGHVAAQQVGRGGVDHAPEVDVVGVRRAPLRPRELVPVQPRVARVGVLQLALQRELRLAGEMADALGAPAVVGGEVARGQPRRQRRERLRPARPRSARGIAHGDQPSDRSRPPARGHGPSPRGDLA